jgi:DNA-binding IclR family transcriptional regulator
MRIRCDAWQVFPWPKAEPKRSRREWVAMRETPIKSGEKLIRVLDLFALDQPTITAVLAAERLRITTSTAYRYLALLTQAGLLEHLPGGRYALGPAISKFDRLMRLSDWFLHESRTSMHWLLENANSGAAVLLCRLFHNRVMCVHDERDKRFTGPLSYERGRFLPLFLGAPSKIIVGHLPRPMARALYADPMSRSQIQKNEFGATCQEFRDRLVEIRRAGICVTNSGADPDRVGISGPIFDRGQRIFGSITLVLEEATATSRAMERASKLVQAAAAEITAALVDSGISPRRQSPLPAQG